MTDTYKILGQENPAQDENAFIYTVPSGKNSAISNISVVNPAIHLQLILSTLSQQQTFHRFNLVGFSMEQQLKVQAMKVMQVVGNTAIRPYLETVPYLQLGFLMLMLQAVLFACMKLMANHVCSVVQISLVHMETILESS